MKVFWLEKAYDDSGNTRFQDIWPVDPEPADWFDIWSFRCESRAAVWPPGGALVEVLNPQAPIGNFVFLHQGGLGMDRITCNRLRDTFPKNIELLDMRTRDRRSYQLLNILDCGDSIDEDRSEWFSLPTRARVSITRFAFRPERLPDSSLFKAKAAPAKIFVRTGLPEDRDFKAQYEKAGMRGLEFREIWNDEGAPIPTVSL
jgi:hypothetical protein